MRLSHNFISWGKLFYQKVYVDHANVYKGYWVSITVMKTSLLRRKDLVLGTDQQIHMLFPVVMERLCVMLG